MVLAGQRPETIMEICSRAMSFWTYQVLETQIFAVSVAMTVQLLSSVTRYNAPSLEENVSL